MESAVSVLQLQRKSLLHVLHKCFLYFGFEIFVNEIEFMEIKKKILCWNAFRCPNVIMKVVQKIFSLTVQ